MLHTLQTLASFGLVLGVLVTIHELGHYFAARWAGIHVEAFSIGFGPSLLSWTDSRETVWKIALLPLGGFVKMHGMALNVADEAVVDQTATRIGHAYFEKTLKQRSVVAAAGPVANFALAIVLFVALFMALGKQEPLPVIGEVTPASAAEMAGLKTGDTITAVDGHPISRFEELRSLVAGAPGRTLQLAVHRGTGSDSKDLVLPVTVRAEPEGSTTVGRLGVSSGATASIRLNPLQAVYAGVEQAWEVLWQTILGLVHIITSGHGVNELGGPIKIAQLSGQVAQLGISNLIAFIAMLSINLGLVNLLPIPILDGGHLMFYAAEGLRGRPIPPKALDYGYRVGFAIIGSLFVVITWNDLVHTGAVRWVTHLIG